MTAAQHKCLFNTLVHQRLAEQFATVNDCHSQIPSIQPWDFQSVTLEPNQTDLV
jgi:hypothetical protein